MGRPGAAAGGPRNRGRRPYAAAGCVSAGAEPVQRSPRAARPLAFQQSLFVRRYGCCRRPAGLFRGDRYLAAGLPPGTVQREGRGPGGRRTPRRTGVSEVPGGIPARDRTRRRDAASAMGASDTWRAAPGGARVVRRTRVPDSTRRALAGSSGNLLSRCRERGHALARGDGYRGKEQRGSSGQRVRRGVGSRSRARARGGFGQPVVAGGPARLSATLDLFLSGNGGRDRVRGRQGGLRGLRSEVGPPPMAHGE